MYTFYRRFIVASLLCSSSLVYANPTIIFSGDQQCRANQTLSGLRYSLPCQTTDVTNSADSGTVASSDPVLSQLPHLQRIRVQFSCESLRPVKIKWQDTEGLNQGEIAPQTSGYALAVDVASISSGRELLFHLTGLEGGIQALKPGCLAEVQLNMVYPDPKALDAYLRVLSRENKNLGRIFQDATPDLSGDTLRAAIDEALDVLDLLGTNADPVSQIQISDSIEKLKTARQEIEQSCGAGLAAQVCTESQAKVRATVDKLLKDSAAEFKKVQNFIQIERTRLEAQSAMSDISSGLQTLQQKYFPTL